MKNPNKIIKLKDKSVNLNICRMSVSFFEEDFTGNVVAPDFESYIVFAPLLDPLIRDLHCVTVTGDLPDQPSPRFFLEDDAPASSATSSVIRETISVLQERDLDPSGKYVMAGVVESSRNLAEFQLPLTMRIRDLEESERIITDTIIGPELTNILAEGSSEDEAGTYYTLSEIIDPFNEIRARLAASGLLLPITECENSDERKLHGKHWPYGRGVFVTSAGDLAIWVNVLDHIRIISCTSEDRPGRVGRAYIRLATVMNVFDKSFLFRFDKKLGFLTSRPAAIGNTLRFDLIVKFAGLSKNPDDLKHLCVVRGLRIHPTLRRDTVRLGNQQSLSIGELQTYQDFDRAVTNVLTLEKEMAMNSSVKIATVIANIFKKRRMSGTRGNFRS